MTQACPKCGQTAKEEAVACARCGLLRERWATFSTQPAAHPVLDPLWQQALLDWQDERRHKALAVVAAGDWAALSGLGQRYQGVLRERPSDPVATAALDGVIKAAMALPPPTRPQGLPRSVQATRAAFGVLLLVLSGYVFYLLWRQMGHR